MPFQATSAETRRERGGGVKGWQSDRLKDQPVEAVRSGRIWSSSITVNSVRESNRRAKFAPSKSEPGKMAVLGCSVSQFSRSVRSVQQDYQGRRLRESLCFMSLSDALNA